MSAANQVIPFDKGYLPVPNEPLITSILRQYEYVLIESLISSFGLDFIIRDQHGGDVDTILNVRKIGIDPEMKYKNEQNQKDYENKSAYNYNAYHDGNSTFQTMKKQEKKQFQTSGKPLSDAYTGNDLYFYSKGSEKGNEDKQASIDHSLTAYTIDSDPGRVLSGLKGEDLANSKENLVFTNKSLNSSMGNTKESKVLVNVPSVLKADFGVDKAQCQILSDIANEKGANGFVDILKILNSNELDNTTKKKIEETYMPLVDLEPFFKKNPELQKKYKEEWQNICIDNKCSYLNILKLQNEGKLGNKKDSVKKKIDASLVQPVDIPRYIELNPDLDEKTKSNLMETYNRAKKSYETKLAYTYYSSIKFRKDLVYAATNVGFRMGVRQALGFVFAEIWFSVKNEFQKLDSKDADLKEYLEAVAYGVQKGYENSKEKYPELFLRFINGAVAGAISSLTTTLCNIFLTTAKNTVKIIRQSYPSMIEALKILLINPDDYELGDRIRAVIKVLSVGASVIVGVLVSDAIAHTPIGTIGQIGGIVQNFCGVFVTGIMSCTLLMFMDRSDLMNNLVQCLNNIHTLETEINYYRKLADYFERYAAELMQLDLKEFKKETMAFHVIAEKLNSIKNENELNAVLKDTFLSMGLPLPWQGDFDTFMKDKTTRLVFE